VAEIFMIHTLSTHWQRTVTVSGPWWWWWKWKCTR